MYEFDQKKKIKINTYFFQKDIKHKEDIIATHSKKFEELKEFTYNLNETNFKKLKELAISSNGFLTLELRRKIYDKILLLGEASVENEKDVNKRKEIEKLIARYDNLQLAKKVSLNQSAISLSVAKKCPIV